MKFLIKYLCLLWCSVIAFNPLEATEATPVLHLFKGDVFLDDVKASKGAAVPYKTMVRVEGDKSYAIVKYPSGSTALFKKGMAKVVLHEKLESVSILKGVVYVYVKKSLKPGTASGMSRFTVQTPKISMGVRGTKFMVQHDDEGSYLCVCEGTVEARSGTNQFMVNKGEDFLARISKAEEKVTKANQMMMSMAKSGFELMGQPVK